MTPTLFFALASAAGGPAATTVAYHIEASLLQIDRFGRPAAIGADATMAAASSSFGLGKFRLALDLQSGENGIMSVVLRPDAVNRVSETDKQPAFELDTRTGETYQPTPTLRLLDAYQIHWIRGRSLELAAGVWEELAARSVSYPELLAFGLTAQLPAKFAGGRVRWQRRGASSSDYGVDLFVFQGDEDRAEAIGGGDQPLYHAPVARDPHQAAALVGQWQVDKRLKLGVVLGFGDSSELGGRRSEQFAQMTGRWSERFRDHELVVSVDGRQVMEQWRNDTLKVAPRVQQSLSVTSTFGLVPEHWALFGAHLGAAQHAKNELTLNELRSYRGWQIDAGYQAQLGQGMALTLLLNQERRRMTASGEAEQGGIADNGTDRTTVRRVGVQLDYLLNGNA